MRYFRVSRNQHQVGNVIWEAEIGQNNLAKILISMGLIASRDQVGIQNMISGGYASAVKEAALESMRQKNYSALPIRFCNMMVFSELSDAIEFNNNFRNAKNKVYEIETETTPFCGDMKMLDVIKDSSVDSLLEMANCYWSGERTENPISEFIFDRNYYKPIVLRQVI